MKEETALSTYELAVARIAEIDKEIAALKGKREAYDEMRSCLYELAQKEKAEKGAEV